ncbi:ISL3 family transposase [Agrobacterium tumefaciens]|nr:ISL3 family transposase [Agrobacterium tumefaciens]
MHLALSLIWMIALRFGWSFSIKVLNDGIMRRVRVRDGLKSCCRDRATDRENLEWLYNHDRSRRFAPSC